jgi:N-acetylglucosamine malate deacetylase 1
LETTKRIRVEEAKQVAQILGAHFHVPFCNDLEIFYNLENQRRVTAVIRTVKPAGANNFFKTPCLMELH